MFGNVASGQAILKEFYTVTQKENGTFTFWGQPLEEIYQRTIEKIAKFDKKEETPKQNAEPLRRGQLKTAGK